MQYYVLFLSGFFFITLIQCGFPDDYIHIDYIKKKYPEIDAHALKVQAVRDGQTAPIKSDKITRLLSLISPKYPLEVSMGGGGTGSIIFGVPYYVFVPCIFLTYWLAKRY